MFQPNSIRSLISKRNSSRAQSASQPDPTKQSASSLDPDYDTILQIKLITKCTHPQIIEIENKIDNIRQWRQHQKQLLQQRLKFNAELAHQTNLIHMKYMQKQAEREQKELRDILDKLKDDKQEIKIKENQQLYDSQRIFNVLNQTDKWRERLKNSNDIVSNSQGLQANYSGLVSQMDKMSTIFTKQQQQSKQNNKTSQKVDAKLLQKQMDQIQNQLREIQELLGDDKKENKKSGGQ